MYNKDRKGKANSWQLLYKTVCGLNCRAFKCKGTGTSMKETKAFSGHEKITKMKMNEERNVTGCKTNKLKNKKITH